MTLTLLISLAAAIASLVLVAVWALFVSLHRSAQLLDAVVPTFEQRRRPRSMRRNTSALL
jgi:predicted GNAT superfamily acetyltransferase